MTNRWFFQSVVLGLLLVGCAVDQLPCLSDRERLQLGAAALVKSPVLPEVRLKYSRYLDDRYAYLAYHGHIPQRDWKQIEQLLQERRRLWQGLAEGMLNALMRESGLTFSHSVIDVYLVHAPSGYVDPVVVPIQTDAELFVRFVVHELAHKLILDNTEGCDIETLWGFMFPDEQDLVTRNHVVVYALLDRVYRDVLYDDAVLARENFSVAHNYGYLNALIRLRRSGGSEAVLGRLRLLTAACTKVHLAAE